MARFLSADTIVPGMTSAVGGAGSIGPDDSASMKALTVDYHETGFVSTVNAEQDLTEQKGFWSQLSSDDKQQDKRARAPFGPANPQALNRYSYVLNNPQRYTDPTGHSVYLSHEDAAKVSEFLIALADQLRNDAKSIDWTRLGYDTVFAMFGGLPGLGLALLQEIIWRFGEYAASVMLRNWGETIRDQNGANGVAIGVFVDKSGKFTSHWLIIVNRDNGNNSKIWLDPIYGSKVWLSAGAELGAEPISSAKGKAWYKTAHFYEDEHQYAKCGACRVVNVLVNGQ